MMQVYFSVKCWVFSTTFPRRIQCKEICKLRTHPLHLLISVTMRTFHCKTQHLAIYFPFDFFVTQLSH